MVEMRNGERCALGGKEECAAVGDLRCSVWDRRVKGADVSSLLLLDVVVDL